MKKKATRTEMSTSARADRGIASLLGIDASLLALARAGELKLPDWWDEIFGGVSDDLNCFADAYRDARISFELGEAGMSPTPSPAQGDARISFELGEAEEGSKTKSSRQGNLAWEAAKSAVELSRIPKRRRKERREWIGELSFLLHLCGIEMACIGRGNCAGWERFVDSGYVEFKGRSSGDGDRVLLTSKGRKYLARNRGNLGRAWSFCESACDRYLCAMVMRLRGIYDGPRSASRRRDVLAALLLNEEIGKEGRRTESQRVEILEQLKVIPAVKTLRKNDGVHSIVAKDLKVIRDVGKRYLESANRERNRRGVQSKK